MKSEETGFTCPRCKSHFFGTESMATEYPDMSGWLVFCHGFQCGWYGPYLEHVSNEGRPEELE